MSRDSQTATDAQGDRNSSLSDRVRSLRLQQNKRPNRNRGSTLPWLLCGLLALSTAAFGYQAFTAKPAQPQSGESTPGGDPNAENPTGATEQTASSGDVALEMKGYIVARHRIQVSPRVGGVIEKLNIEEGMKVKKGDVLAQLEIIDYRADYLIAKHAVEAAKQRWEELKSFRPEEIAQAKAELSEATAQFEQKRLDLKRTERLLGTGAQPRREYEMALSEKQMMERRVSRLRSALNLMEAGPRKEKLYAAEAEKERAEAELVKAKWRLDNCTILAPVSGTILTKGAEEGNIVNPAAFNVSSSLCEMADLSNLEVDLTVQERDIAKVKVGQPCIIMPEAFLKDDAFRKIHPQGYTGEVSRLMPVADRAKGAIPVRVKVNVPREEAGVYLKPDMSVLVTLKKQEQ